MTTAERILDLLRSAREPLAGPEIARQVGVSRAAVWKHVERLVSDGYRIERHNRGGYRLTDAPDRLLPAEIRRHLESDRIGRVVHHYDTIDSTNRRAMEIARAGAAEGEVVIAEGQSGGRGRLGRSFFSPHGVSLYASVVLRPPLPPMRAPVVTLVAGLAVVEVVERHAGLRPGLKWPNDVHLAGKKTCGILTEMESEADRILHVICGIGVNLNVAAEEFPEELRPIATSVLAASGRRVDRVSFAADLFTRFERHYDAFLQSGFAPLRARWESYSVLHDRPVVVSGVGERIEGVVIGLDDDGCLRLRTRDGEVTRVVAGDVTLRQ